MLEVAEEKIKRGRGRPKGAKNRPLEERRLKPIVNEPDNAPPKGMASYGRIIALRHAERAIARLAHLIDNAENEQAQISACKEILDRAYGKAPQAITGEDGGPLRNEVIIRIIEAGIGARHPAAIEGVGYTSDEI